MQIRRAPGMQIGGGMFAATHVFTYLAHNTSADFSCYRAFFDGSNAELAAGGGSTLYVAKLVVCRRGRVGLDCGNELRASPARYCHSCGTGSGFMGCCMFERTIARQRSSFKPLSHMGSARY